MGTFMTGDHAFHPLHGRVEVLTHDKARKLVVAVTDSKHIVTVHPFSLSFISVPKPKFDLTVIGANGVKYHMGPFDRSQIKDKVSGNDLNWDIVESITITRAKG